MRHTAPITIENINAPPLPISKTRKGMATKAVIHRFKCILTGLPGYKLYEFALRF